MADDATTVTDKIEDSTTSTISDSGKVDSAQVVDPKVDSKDTPQPDLTTQQAIQLYNALNNPETAADVVKTLARAVGLNIETPKQTQVAKKTIAALITEALGEDNSILASQLAPVLESAINQTVEERVKPIREEINQARVQEFTTRIDRAFEELEVETKGESKRLEPIMTKLMDQVNPGEKSTPESYLKLIYRMAKSEFDEAEKIKAQNAKAAANKKAASVPPGVNPDRIKSGSRLPTVKEAVLAAIRGETLE